MDKEYVVTLHRKEDLEQFYNEMQLTNFPLVMKRPLSRNTHYMMTEEQAEQLRQDSRVWDVKAVDSFYVRRQTINNEPYAVTGNFWKADTVAPATVSPNDFQWGHLHCAGDQVQRGKAQFGAINQGGTYEQVNESVEVFSNGRYVDVVICDDPVSYDSEEWYSPTSNQTRFVQYQWFNELNSAVGSIDDDGQTLPTGTITYGTNDATPQFHGNHVCGTVAGQHYGWAREANIYNMAITDPWLSGQQFPALLIFDYLRAFHLNKPLNAAGYRNPTITNHSYGGIVPMTTGSGLLTFGDLAAVQYQGVVYNAGNPGPSGWTEAGVETDFGVRFGVDVIPAWSAAVSADVIDAINDGVVIIGAAGNDNLLFETVNGPNWNNAIQITGVGTYYYMRGGWPNSPDSGSINVGAISNQANFRRAVFTNYGPAIDVFAPGQNILSAYGNSGGLVDSKYTQGSANYFYPESGTSMASPQVCGIAACLASGKERYTQDDFIGYLQNHSIIGDMTFDLAGGGYDDNSSRQGSPNRYLHVENPRPSVGYLQERKGKRVTGQTFPRTAIYNTVAPGLDIVTDGLVLYLDAGNTSSYPGSGTTWTDLSGSGNNGTLTNGPTYSSDNGGTIVFDGSDDLVSISDSSSIDVTPTVTISAWINPSGFGENNYGRIIDSNDSYRFFLNNSTVTSGIRYWPNVGNVITVANCVTLDEWANFVVVHSGSNLTIYKNGVSIETFTGMDTLPSTSSGLTIGNSSVGDRAFEGKISQVLVYNKALTAAEVAQNYNALKGRYEA